MFLTSNDWFLKRAMLYQLILLVLILCAFAPVRAFAQTRDCFVELKEFRTSDCEPGENWVSTCTEVIPLSSGVNAEGEPCENWKAELGSNYELVLSGASSIPLETVMLQFDNVDELTDGASIDLSHGVNAVRSIRRRDADENGIYIFRIHLDNEFNIAGDAQTEVLTIKANPMDIDTPIRLRNITVRFVPLSDSSTSPVSGSKKIYSTDDLTTDDCSNAAGEKTSKCRAYKSRNAVGKLQLAKGSKSLSCSGFLVSSTHFLTNYHCIQDDGTFNLDGDNVFFRKPRNKDDPQPRDCGFTDVIFETMDPLEKKKFRVSCEEIVAYSVYYDYALLKLKSSDFDDDLKGITPLELSTVKPTQKYARSTVVQYPHGVYKGYADDCIAYMLPDDSVRTKLWPKVVDVDVENNREYSFSVMIGHSCDTAKASSGSPIIDLDTGKVIALHSNGKERCEGSGGNDYDYWLHSLFAGNLNHEESAILEDHPKLKDEYEEWISSTEKGADFSSYPAVLGWNKGRDMSVISKHISPHLKQ